MVKVNGEAQLAAVQQHADVIARVVQTVPRASAAVLVAAVVAAPAGRVPIVQRTVLTGRAAASAAALVRSAAVRAV
eukprot:121435-Chlamydomonas_euryale.AAC.1